MRALRNYLFIIFLLILFPTSLYADLVPGHLNYRTIHSDHFRINYPEGYEVYAKKAAEYLEELREVIGNEYNVYPKGKVEVVLTDQHDEANGFATVIPYNMIVLRLVPPVAGSSLAYYDDWLPLLAAHEYTHILHLSDAKYPAKILKFLLGKIVAPNALSPRWVTEGMATYYESAVTGFGRGRSSYSEMILRTDIVRDKFLPLDKASGSMYDWPAWRAAYIYGAHFWNYLTETYGREKLGEFSNKYGASLWFFSLKNKSRRVFGKHFYKLWEDWKNNLREKYAKEIALYQENKSSGKALLTSKKAFLSSPSWSPDGESLAYVSTSSHRASEVRLKSEEEDKLLFKDHAPAQLAWSPDGKYIAFTSQGSHKHGYYYNDLYQYDLTTKKISTLTKGARARDATYSPDGSRIAVCVREKDRDRIGIYDIEAKKLSMVGHTPPDTQLDHLSWSPNGNFIAASVWSKGFRNIVVYNDDGKIIRTVTKGRHTNITPRFGPNGRYLYYTSDRDGIFNIYRYDWKRRHTGRVSKVLTGAFAPALKPHSSLLAYQYYTGDGYEIRLIPSDPIAKPTARKEKLSIKTTEPLLKEPDHKTSRDIDFKDKPYSSLSTALLPHYIRPNAIFLDNAIFVSTLIGSQDPLGRHAWYGNVNYRTDAEFVGFGAGYQYGRYNPKFFLGYSNFAVNFGNIFGTGTDFFEERRRGFAGVSTTLKGEHALSFQYFFEDRSAESAIPAGATFQPVLGKFAGVSLRYTWNHRKKFIGAISPEDSYWLRAGIDFTNSFLGSSNNMERTILFTDARQYIEMPWNHHHVIVFRQAGGVALGDTLTQGTFAVGGSLGESPIAQASTRVFTLRGLPLSTFLRDRALVLSAEYRMPLFSAQSGLGTAPIFLNQASLAFFADYGNAWNKGDTPSFKNFFDPFLLGVGAELRGHFVLGYHISIMGRLGYAIIVTNRDRVGHLTDPILGQTINNGILILQLGTSF